MISGKLLKRVQSSSIPHPSSSCFPLSSLPTSVVGRGRRTTSRTLTTTISSININNNKKNRFGGNSMRLQDRWFRSATTAILLSTSFYPTTTTTTTNTAMALSTSSSSSSSPSARVGGVGSCSNLSPTSPLAKLTLDNSWPRQLSAETLENLQKSRKFEKLPNDDDNRNRRPVFNGHYVLVKPSGLPQPSLILLSNDVAKNVLSLTEEQIDSEDFVQWVSGNLALDETWATPYALSIMGTRYTNNCPYGTGNGYGDGRAISIAEINGHEMQLKGAGKTPFHRGADGRAVLRSSIREFLASEAMHYLGVETTRALSLVKSEKETVSRPWYTADAVLQIPTMDDPRLSKYPESERRELIASLRTNSKADPNIMIRESCAITCRVATSFTRIGHLDLFARRVERITMANAMHSNDDGEKRYDTSTNEWKELEEIIWHACFREYKKDAYDPFIDDKDLAGAATKLLELSAVKIATMVSNWLRVGFAQGNFNADNCLVGGKTMDYGPFGWMEEYSPVFAKWTGSGQHFGFLNQPSAGFANYRILVESVAPVIAQANGEDFDAVVERFLEQASSVFDEKTSEVFRMKMGLLPGSDVGDDVWEELQPLLRTSRTDWTLFWRQLTYVMRDFPDVKSTNYDEMLKALEGNGESSPFYEPLSPEKQKEWLNWIKQWREILEAANVENAFERMRTINPKFVLREWMLVDAYSSAADDDYTLLQELYELIQHPYDEGSENEIKEYYRRAPDATLAQGGTAFMS